MVLSCLGLGITALVDFSSSYGFLFFPLESSKGEWVVLAFCSRGLRLRHGKPKEQGNEHLGFWLSNALIINQFCLAELGDVVLVPPGVFVVPSGVSIAGGSHRTLPMMCRVCPSEFFNSDNDEMQEENNCLVSLCPRQAGTEGIHSHRSCRLQPRSPNGTPSTSSA